MQFGVKQFPQNLRSVWILKIFELYFPYLRFSGRAIIELKMQSICEAAPLSAPTAAANLSSLWWRTELNPSSLSLDLFFD